MSYTIQGVTNKVLSRGTHICTSEYKTRNASRPTHNGMDMVGYNSSLDDVVAADAGVVVSTGYDADGAGYYVRLKHDNADSLYFHMRSGSIVVSKGQTVKKGQKLGYMGNTGHSFGAHLHFEVRVNNVAVDPRPYLTGVQKLVKVAVPVQPVLPAPRPGRYKVVVSLVQVRTGPGTSYRAKYFKELTLNARRQILALNASRPANGYVKDLVCDVTEVRKVGSLYYGKTASGWMGLQTAYVKYAKRIS